MKSQYRCPLARLCAGVGLACLAGALAAPAARAECGDYVIIGARHGASEATAESSRAVAPMPLHPGPVAPDGQPAPCQGPSCSRRSAPPLAPPAPPAPVRDHHWAWVAAPAAPPAAGPTASVAEVRAFRPEPLGPSIFHPPR